MSLSTTAVKEMFDNYHVAKKSRPALYKCRDGAVNVTLPQSLCWVYSNRAAGDSGGESPRPVGIRLLPAKVKSMYGTQDQALDHIFSSVDNLAEFIAGSDCDGAEHLQKKLFKKRIQKTMQNSQDHNNSIEMQLLRLAIDTRDNELAKMVLSGQVDQFRKTV